MTGDGTSRMGGEGGSRTMTGEGTSRGGDMLGEGAPRKDDMAGEGASRARTVRPLREEEGREMGEAADWRFVSTGFLRRVRNLTKWP